MPRRLKEPKKAKKLIKPSWEDRMEGLLFQGWRSVKRHWFPISLGAGLFFFMTFSLLFVHFKSSREEARARALLYEAQQEEDVHKRIEALKALSLAYPHKKATSEALYLLGHDYYSVSNFEASEKAYSALIQEPSHPLLTPAGLQGLGDAFRAQGQCQEAISYYRMLQQDYPDSFLVPKASYMLGLCYEKLQEEQKAQEAYEKIVSSYPQNYWAYKAKSRLLTLSTRPKPGREEEVLSSP